ncbi:MAG: hypothetical protein KA198_11095, partial [Chitinophagaceae bacterium]|nr:hypothetical protein [Chitinophagaceae bacterium]
MLNKLIPLLFLLTAIIISCQDADTSTSNQEESCNKPIKDPNDVKPMALMMRTMANYCDSMRLQINQGQVVDSVKYPL